MEDQPPEETQEQQTQRDERLAQLEDSLARVQADYANYRRRTQQRQEEIQQQAAARLVHDLLPIIDNLQLAVRQLPQEDRGNFYEGVELILSQLLSVLEDHGVTRIEDTDTFDPAKHEAMLTEPSDKPKGTILEVLQPGYCMGGKVLRTAKVKLSTGDTNNE